MTDRVSETDRGWQNVVRTINAFLASFRVLDGEALTEREDAEKEAWSLARDAVVDRLAERMDQADDVDAG
jgi:hypothetical protein